jgi:hypothetical protein
MAPSVNGVLAYIPEYTADVCGIILGASVAVQVIPALITGRSSFGPGWSERRTRAWACLGVAVGIGLALLVFVLSPQQQGVTDPGDRWGLSTSTSKVILGTWILLIAAVTAWNLSRERRFLRDDARARRDDRRSAIPPS